MPENCAQSVLGTLVIGGGPAGIGLLLAARTGGLLQSLLSRRLTILERGRALGAGMLGQFAIRSDSLAESFFRAVAAMGEPSLSTVFATQAGQEMLQHRGKPVSLSLAADFLAATSDALRGAMAALWYDPFVTGTEAISARRTTAGYWRVLCRSGFGETEHEARTLVLAAGAEQPPELLETDLVNGQHPLSKYGGKIVQSSELLSTVGVRRIEGLLSKLNSPKVAIIGGSHSAAASACLLLNAMPGVAFGDGCVTLLHRKPLRLTYDNDATARADGYSDFGDLDICPSTQRVFPLAGFRGDSRELMRRAWQLGGCGPEPRLSFHQFTDETSGEAAQILEKADLIVTALGYRPRALPLYDASGTRITLRSDHRRPLVDKQSRVMSINEEPIPGVFGIGLAAGYPLSGTHGEPSFTGQANGLALWHSKIGLDIVRAALA